MFKSFGFSKQSIHSIPIYKEKDSIAVLMMNNSIFKLNYNELEKTKYKSLQEFYSKNYEMTFGTIELINKPIDEKNS